MRDPDTEWVNVGTYRVRSTTATPWGCGVAGQARPADPREIFRAGKPCPVVISCGHDPLLFLSSGNEVNYGTSEFAHAGGHRGVPFETSRASFTACRCRPMREIVLEGEIVAEDMRRKVRSESGRDITRARSAPIRRCGSSASITATGRSSPWRRPGRPPSDYSFSKCVIKSAMIWDQVEQAGLAGVQGVWCHECGGGAALQCHLDQAGLCGPRQAGGAARGQLPCRRLSRPLRRGGRRGHRPDRYLRRGLGDGTRCDPEEDIDIIRRAWSGALDPRKRKGDSTNTRAIVDACRPFEWLSEFPPVAEFEPRAARQNPGEMGPPAAPGLGESGCITIVRASRRSASRCSSA